MLAGPSWRQARALANLQPMLSLTDRLALMRTELANERTLLAYWRTALALAAAGVALVEVFAAPILVALGWSLMPAGVLVLLLGWIRFRGVRRRLADLGRDGAEGGIGRSGPR